MGIYKDKRDKTRKELIDAFWNVYEKADTFSDITIKKITDEAGVYRGTFYVHLDDVYDLLHQSEKELLNSFTFRNLGSLEFYQEEQLQQCIQYMYKNRRYYLILLSEKGDADFRMELLKRLMQMIYPDFFNQNISVENHFVIEFMAGGLMNATLYYLKEKKLTEKTMVELFYQLLSSCQKNLRPDHTE